MKKGLAIVLSLWMMCLTTIGYAVTYTLPEKLGRQLAIGSGMKGSFVLNAEGDSETAAALRLFNQAEIQVRGMMSDKDWHYYLYQTDEAENQWARTDLYRKDGAVYMKSQLLKIDRLAVYEGEKIGLIGENGMGKTTLMRVLAGELTPEEGFVRRTVPAAMIHQQGDADAGADSETRAVFRSSETREGLSGGAAGAPAGGRTHHGSRPGRAGRTAEKTGRV